MKEDAMLLLRGFDSVSCSLSQLSDNLENALQGARNLAKPPTLTEILHYTMEKERSEENQSKENKCEGYKGKEGSEEGGNRGLKRKLDSEESSENPQQDDDTKRENQQVLKELGKFKKAKNLAISMASKEDTLAQELKTMRSDFRFMQERSSLLEEDNEVFVMDMAQGYHQKKMTCLLLEVNDDSPPVQAARQLEFFKGRSEIGGPTTKVLPGALAIAQHHDAVSGTLKQHVVDDYAKLLLIGYKQVSLLRTPRVTGKITTKVDVFSFGMVLMELLTGGMALDEDRPNESQYLVAWNIKSSKEKLIAAIDPALDVKQESTLDNIYTVAELAGYCTARETGQRPDMSYVVNIFAPLVEKWKTLEEDTDGECGID
ncbi:putative receptor protein kinase TMK1 [Capsicum chinense]|nr:putative receptor protein kinase TMK1 [Capsicum chinense]